MSERVSAPEDVIREALNGIPTYCGCSWPADDGWEGWKHDASCETGRGMSKWEERGLAALTQLVEDWQEALDFQKGRTARAVARAEAAEAALRRIAELDESWVVTDNVRGTHLVKLARAALSKIGDQ
jgi:hypothetical protein